MPEPVDLDCRGLACPQPVLQCKDLIESDSPGTMTVLVDNEASRANVTRFLESRGYAVATEHDGGQWRLTATAQGGAEAGAAATGPAEATGAAPQAGPSQVCVFIPADVMGTGDDELGGKLMVNFTATLPELGDELWRIVLVNAGVRMAVPGHPCFDNLKALEDAGVSILVCGTCLDFFDLLEKRGLGQTTNMLDVVTSLQLASKVIRV